MSRFLHNIIATARSPARSVHPIVPSIHEDAPTETPLVFDPPVSPRSVASREPREFAEPSRKATFEVNVKEDPPFVATAQAGNPNTMRDESALPNGQTERPFQPISPLSNASGPESRGHTDPPAGTPNPTSGVLLHDDFDNAADAAAMETTAARYSPLVLEGSAPRSSPQALPAPPTRSTDQSRSNRDLARQQRPPPRDPDEIQIHIGRIEVTAVPPPQVKAAPAPTRKSPSLDEYLKRRPGRAR